MTIGLSDQIAPLGSFPIIEDTDAKGSLRIVANATERNAISDARRKVKMPVVQADTGDWYQLKASPWVHDDTDWEPATVGAGSASGTFVLRNGSTATGTIGPTWASILTKLVAAQGIRSVLVDDQGGSAFVIPQDGNQNFDGQLDIIGVDRLRGHLTVNGNAFRNVRSLRNLTMTLPSGQATAIMTGPLSGESVQYKGDLFVEDCSIIGQAGTAFFGPTRVGGGPYAYAAIRLVIRGKFGLSGRLWEVPPTTTSELYVGTGVTIPSNCIQGAAGTTLNVFVEPGGKFNTQATTFLGTLNVFTLGISGIQAGGSHVTTRGELNFIGSVAVTDDFANDRITVNVTSVTTAFHFNPAGVESGNSYTNWNNLWAAVTATKGLKIITVDGSPTVPSGTYLASGLVEIVGSAVGQTAPNWTTLSFASGAKIRNLRAARNVSFSYTTTPLTQGDAVDDVWLGSITLENFDATTGSSTPVITYPTNTPNSAQNGMKLFLEGQFALRSTARLITWAPDLTTHELHVGPGIDVPTNTVSGGTISPSNSNLNVFVRSGGSFASSQSGLVGNVNVTYQTTVSVQNSGSFIAARRHINFTGSAVTSVSDDPSNNRINVTLSKDGGAASLTVQEEGVSVSAQPTMNFIGISVTAVDDPGNSRINVTVDPFLTFRPPGGTGPTDIVAKIVRYSSTYSNNNISLSNPGGGIVDVNITPYFRFLKNGTLQGHRPQVNFTGLGVVLSDDSGNNRMNIAVDPPTIQDEGSSVGARTIINFVGSGVTVTDDPGNSRILVTVPGTGSIAVQDEGSTVNAAISKFNFTGAGITATDDPGNGRVNIDVPGTAFIVVQDEGTNIVSSLDKMNFVGAGVTASYNIGLDRVDVTVPGTINVQDEGSAAGTRTTINFIGAGVTAVDNSINGRVNVTIPGLQVLEEGTNAGSPRPAINFIGANITAVDNPGANRVDVTLGTGAGTVDFQDEGTGVATRGTANFVGAGVTVTDDSLNGRVTITIPGGSASTSVQKDGSAIGTRPNVNFTGNVSATDNSGSNRVDINIQSPSVTVKEGGTTAGTVYNTWTAAYAAVATNQGGVRTILVDDSIAQSSTGATFSSLAGQIEIVGIPSGSDVRASINPQYSRQLVSPKALRHLKMTATSNGSTATSAVVFGASTSDSDYCEIENCEILNSYSVGGPAFFGFIRDTILRIRGPFAYTLSNSTKLFNISQAGKTLTIYLEEGVVIGSDVLLGVSSTAVNVFLSPGASFSTTQTGYSGILTVNSYTAGLSVQKDGTLVAARDTINFTGPVTVTDTGLKVNVAIQSDTRDDGAPSRAMSLRSMRGGSLPAQYISVVQTGGAKPMTWMRRAGGGMAISQLRWVEVAGGAWKLKAASYPKLADAGFIVTYSEAKSSLHTSGKWTFAVGQSTLDATDDASSFAYTSPGAGFSTGPRTFVTTAIADITGTPVEHVFATSNVDDAVYHKAVGSASGAMSLALSVGTGSAPTAIVTDHKNRVWVARAGVFGLTRYDVSSTGTLINPATAGIASPVNCATFDGKYVWLGSSNRLQRVDTETLEVTAVPTSGNVTGVHFDGSSIWASFNNGVQRFNPETTEQVWTITGASIGAGFAFEVTGPPDPDLGIVFVSFDNGATGQVYALREKVIGASTSILSAGVPVGSQEFLNITGATITEDPTNGKIDISIDPALTILDEGSVVATRPKVNFIGAGITAVDNPGQNRVDVTVTTSSSLIVDEEGTTVGTRPEINFIGPSVTAVDDSGNNRVNVTVGPSVAVQEEGSAVSTRPAINFIGPSVTAVDNSGSNRVDVTVGPSVTVQEEGSTVGTRPTINFIGGTITAVDNSGANRVDVTVTSTSGYTTIQDEGSAVTARSTVNFIGPGVTAVDNSLNSRTNVTIPGTTVQDEGSALTYAPIINFTGGGVTATYDSGNGRINVNVPTAGGSTLDFYDEGVFVAAQPAADFVGTGVSVTDDPGNSKVIVTINGSGSAVPGDTGAYVRQVHASYISPTLNVNYQLRNQEASAAGWPMAQFRGIAYVAGPKPTYSGIVLASVDMVDFSIIDVVDNSLGAVSDLVIFSINNGGNDYGTAAIVHAGGVAFKQFSPSGFAGNFYPFNGTLFATQAAGAGGRAVAVDEGNYGTRVWVTRPGNNNVVWYLGHDPINTNASVNPGLGTPIVCMAYSPYHGMFLATATDIYVAAVNGATLGTATLLVSLSGVVDMKFDGERLLVVKSGILRAIDPSTGSTMWSRTDSNIVTKSRIALSIHGLFTVTGAYADGGVSIRDYAGHEVSRSFCSTPGYVTPVTTGAVITDEGCIKQVVEYQTGPSPYNQDDPYDTTGEFIAGMGQTESVRQYFGTVESGVSTTPFNAPNYVPTLGNIRVRRISARITVLTSLAASVAFDIIVNYWNGAVLTPIGTIAFTETGTGTFYIENSSITPFDLIGVSTGITLEVAKSGGGTQAIDWNVEWAASWEKIESLGDTSTVTTTPYTVATTWTATEKCFVNGFELALNVNTALNPGDSIGVEIRKNGTIVTTTSQIEAAGPLTFIASGPLAIVGVAGDVFDLRIRNITNPGSSVDYTLTYERILWSASTIAWRTGSPNSSATWGGSNSSPITSIDFRYLPISSLSNNNLSLNLYKNGTLHDSSSFTQGSFQTIATKTYTPSPSLTLNNGDAFYFEVSTTLEPETWRFTWDTYYIGPNYLSLSTLHAVYPTAAFTDILTSAEPFAAHRSVVTADRLFLPTEVNVGFLKRENTGRVSVFKSPYIPTSYSTSSTISRAERALVHTTGGALTITLATTGFDAGEQVLIQDADGTAGSNSISIDGQSHSIGGIATVYIINNPYGSVLLEWDGTNWGIVSEAGVVVQDEGSSLHSGSPVPKINFTGAGVTAAYDTGNKVVNVTIPGANAAIVGPPSRMPVPAAALYYKFDQTTAGSSITNYGTASTAGNGTIGLGLATTAVRDAIGEQFPRALKLTDSGDARVSFPHSGVTWPTSTMTVWCSFIPTGRLSATSRIFFKQTANASWSSPFTQMSVGWDATGLVFQMITSGGTATITVPYPESDLPLNQPMTVGMTLASGVVTAYVNGQSVGTSTPTGTFSAGTGDLILGNYDDGSTGAQERIGGLYHELGVDGSVAQNAAWFEEQYNRFLGRVSTGAIEVQDEGTVVNTRAKMNFVGPGVTVTDDPGNNRVNVTITGGGGGGSGSTAIGIPITATSYASAQRIGRNHIFWSDLFATSNRNLMVTADIGGGATLHIQLEDETTSPVFVTDFQITASPGNSVAIDGGFQSYTGAGWSNLLAWITGGGSATVYAAMLEGDVSTRVVVPMVISDGGGGSTRKGDAGNFLVLDNTDLASAYTIPDTAEQVLIKTSTGPFAFGMNLPQTPPDGWTVTLSDADFQAGTNGFGFLPQSPDTLSNGSGSYTVSTNGGSLTLRFYAGVWYAISVVNITW